MKDLVKAIQVPCVAIRAKRARRILAGLGVITLAALAGCSADQKQDARTALDVSMCVQAVILEHLDEDLKNPVTAAQLGLDITARCYPKPPAADAGVP